MGLIWHLRKRSVLEILPHFGLLAPRTLAVRFEMLHGECLHCRSNSIFKSAMSCAIFSNPESDERVVLAAVGPACPHHDPSVEAAEGCWRSTSASRTAEFLAN